MSDSIKSALQTTDTGLIDLLDSTGYVLLSQFCDPDLVALLLSVSQQRALELRNALGDRVIGIGSAAGYLEIVQRSPGRWDVPISAPEFGLDSRELPWWPLISALLGDDAEHAFSGVVSSEPNSPAQHWHTDSPHEAAEHKAAHAINVLVALHDTPLTMGPTECAGGSHHLTNHLSNPDLVVEELIYQHPNTSPEMLIKNTTSPVPEGYASKMAAGTCLIFDDRILHRGLANQSESTRHVAYFSYRRKGYTTNTHFESVRSVFDASAS